MAQVRNQQHQRVVPYNAALVGTGAYYLAQEFGSLMDGPVIHWPTALAALVTVTCFTKVTTYGLDKLADGFDLIAAKLPKGNKGKAKWATWRDLRKDVLPYGFGPYWGYHQSHWWSRKRAVFADYSSNAMTVGSAGSGKGVGVVIPNMLLIPDSILSTDLKGSNSCMVKDAVEAQGKIFATLNIGGLPHVSALGCDVFYNPLNLIAEDFTTSGHLIFVMDDVEEIIMQLLPEIKDGKGENRFWDDGTRSFTAMATLQSILVHGMEAHFGHAEQMVNNKKDFLRAMLWAAGRLEVADEKGKISHGVMPLEQSPWVACQNPEKVKQFITWYRGKASAIADLLAEKTTSKTGESFLTGAQQALSPYRITSHAHDVMSKSSFRFKDMKEGDKPMVVMITVDSTRMAAQKKLAAMLQKCAFMEFRRSMGKRPVYVQGDESTNFEIYGLCDLLTYGREYGIRIHLYIQSLSAFRATYGQDTLNTLLSETEVKQFLPSTREPETLDLIEKLLGEQSYTNKTHNGQTSDLGVNSYGYAEDGRKLMQAEEIRRTDDAILFVRRNRAARVKVPPYAVIDILRKIVGINPFYGKPFIKRTKLRIGTRRMPVLLRLIKKLKGGKQ